MSLVSLLSNVEDIFSKVLDRKVELYRDANNDLWSMRIPKDHDYRTPAERATDAAWERNRR